jgi:hypothetical protein
MWGNRRSGFMVGEDAIADVEIYAIGLMGCEGRFNLKLLISTQMDCCLANKFVPYI